MGSKTKLSSNCTKRGDDTVNLVTSRKTNARVARPMLGRFDCCISSVKKYCLGTSKCHHQDTFTFHQPIMARLA